MCPSYFRIRISIDEALKRFAEWIEFPQVGPPQEVRESDAVRMACANDAWKSIVAVFVYEYDGWSVFEDFTGYLASLAADRWSALAGQEELVFAGYNDTVPYGQLIVVHSGRVIREFLDDQQDPQDNVNRGELAFEQQSPIKNWIDVAAFVDDDVYATSPNKGLLWMFGEQSNPSR